MSRCRSLDTVITEYIDGQASPEVVTFVTAHLPTCATCRAEVEAESAARQVLRSHAAAARTSGVTPTWRPQTYFLGRPMLTGGASLVVAVLATTVLSSVLLLRTTTVNAVETVGLLGDSFCGAGKHEHLPTGSDGRTCTLNCIQRGASFILVSGTTVYRIGNQQFPNLDAFANTRVAVTGTLANGTITVSRVVATADPQVEAHRLASSITDQSEVSHE